MEEIDEIDRKIIEHFGEIDAIFDKLEGRTGETLVLLENEHI
jgi:hypothetical protein